MSPEKRSPVKKTPIIRSAEKTIEYLESCEVTLNTSKDEIGAEFEYEKCKGTNINKIQ
jgi:hypothetical protein